MADTPRPPVRGSLRQYVHRPATSAELDAAARVGPGDVAHADDAWRRNAPRALRGLLRATPIAEPGPTTPGGRTSSA